LRSGRFCKHVCCQHGREKTMKPAVE